MNKLNWLVLHRIPNRIRYFTKAIWLRIKWVMVGFADRVNDIEWHSANAILPPFTLAMGLYAGWQIVSSETLGLAFFFCTFLAYFAYHFSISTMREAGDV